MLVMCRHPYQHNQACYDRTAAESESGFWRCRQSTLLSKEGSHSAGMTHRLGVIVLRLCNGNNFIAKLDNANFPQILKGCSCETTHNSVFYVCEYNQSGIL